VALRSAVVGCPAGADYCHDLLLRPPMQPLAPQHALMIANYVTEQLEEISQLQQQSMTARARDKQKGLLDCVPRWISALSLFSALASRSPRLAADWITAHQAIRQLVTLIHLAVPPDLKAAGLGALAALANPSLPTCSSVSVSGIATLGSSGGGPHVESPDSTRQGGLFTPWASVIWEALHPSVQSHSEHDVSWRASADDLATSVNSVTRMVGANDAHYVASAGIAGGFALGSTPSASPAHFPPRGNSSHHRPAAPAAATGSTGDSVVHSDVEQPGDWMGGDESVPDFLKGIQEDFCVEQRHQTYPQTIAFLKLLQRLFASLTAAGLPLPSATMHYVTWIGDHLLGGLETLAFRNPACKWELTAAALSVLLALLVPYDPYTCTAAEAPPTEAPERRKAVLVPHHVMPTHAISGAARPDGTSNVGRLLRPFPLSP